MDKMKTNKFLDIIHNFNTILNYQINFKVDYKHFDILNDVINKIADKDSI